MKKTISLFIAVILVLSITPFEVGAQLSISPRDTGSVGVGIFGAAIVPQSVKFLGSGSLIGLPFNSTGRIKLQPGPVVGGIVEYQFDPHFTIEGAFGRATASLDKFEGSFKLGPIDLAKASLPLKGDTSIIAALVNLLYHPIGTTGTLNPFIGGGAGIARPESHIVSANLNGFILPTNVKSSENDLALNLLTGANVRISEHVDVGLFYQYLWINSRGLASGATITGESGHFTAHVVGAVIEYRL